MTCALQKESTLRFNFLVFYCGHKPINYKSLNSVWPFFVFFAFFVVSSGILSTPLFFVRYTAQGPEA